MKKTYIVCILMMLVTALSIVIARPINTVSSQSVQDDNSAAIVGIVGQM